MSIIIVSRPCFFAGTDFTKQEKTIKKYTDAGHKPAIVAYIHGTVEFEVGYDIGLCLNAELCSDFEKEQYIEGIYDAKVHGYKNPCKAFMWNSGDEPRCLIVDSLDEEDMEFASNAYQEKRRRL